MKSKETRFAIVFFAIFMLSVAQGQTRSTGKTSRGSQSASKLNPTFSTKPSLLGRPESFVRGMPLAFGWKLGMPRNVHRGSPTRVLKRPVIARANTPDPAISFHTAAAYDSGGLNATSLAMGDVNSDGRPDIVVANCADSFGCGSSGASVGVLLGNADGTFAAPVAYNPGGSVAFSVALADINGDGKPDIVVGELSPSKVRVLLNNGDGTFALTNSYDAGGAGQFSVVVADLNGDGKADVSVASCGTAADGCGGSHGLVGVLLGNGDGTLQSPVTYDTGGYNAHSVVVADVNGDGKLDLLVANECGASASCASGTVGVLLGNGDGTFQTAVTSAAGGVDTMELAIADVNRDGHSDVIAVNECEGASCTGADGGVAVLLGNGDGSFGAAVSYDTGGLSAFSVTVGDIDGDGNPDLVVANECSSTNCLAANGSVGILPGIGDGTFRAAVTFDSGGTEASSVRIADVNGDGRPDVLVANYCGSAGGGTCDEGSVGVLINATLMGSTVALTSSLNPSNFNQQVSFRAAVVPRGMGSPTGAVTFFDGSIQLGSSTLSEGAATFALSTLAVGPHSITAAYGGDVNFATSTSSPLSQVVHGVVVHFSEIKIDFGRRAVHVSSSPQLVTVTNRGNVNMTFSWIGIVGANAGDFSQTATCGPPLAPGASCGISVTFTPLARGARVATVSVVDNGPGSPHRVALSGMGTP